jgi:hypothetical protein
MAPDLRDGVRRKYEDAAEVASYRAVARAGLTLPPLPRCMGATRGLAAPALGHLDPHPFVAARNARPEVEACVGQRDIHHARQQRRGQPARVGGDSAYNCRTAVQHRRA